MSQTDNNMPPQDRAGDAGAAGYAPEKKYPSWLDLFALLGVFLAASILAGVVMAMLTKSENISEGFALFLAYIIQFLSTIVFAVVQKRRRAPQDKPVLRFSFKRVNPAVTLWGLMTVVAVSLVVEPMVDLFPDIYFDSISRIMGIGGWAMLTILVAAPVLEEMLFRGIVQESLTKKYGALRGILIASVVFAVVHVNPPQVINAFFVALMLGYIYYMTHSLVPVMFIHAVNNAISYFSWMLNDEKIVSTSEMIPDKTIYYIVYAIACGVMIIAFISMYRAIKKDSRPL